MEANRFCPHCMSEQRISGERCYVCGERLDSRNASRQLRVGTVLKGRYLVGSALGEGGFGITYIGLDLVLRQRVAIKEFFPDGAANRSGEGRVSPVSGSAGESFGIGMEHFLNEGKILSQFVGDPNVVTVRDWFEENGTAYIVMEYIAGKNLQQLLEEKGKLPFDEAMSIIRPAAECLERIHKQGIIHGDISPSNIMVSEGGTVKLLDFGTARAGGRRKEGDLSLMLKPGYAPEEAYRQNSELGPGLDVYALSATLYKLLTGVTPEPAQDRVFDDRLPPPGKLGAKLTKAQEAGLLKGMALRAENRPGSMDELLKLLGRDRLSLSDRLRSGSGKALIAAVCAVLVLGGAFFAVRASGGDGAKPSESTPEAANEKKESGERVVVRSENAYPIAISSGMEPMEGFERQVLGNPGRTTITATACYVGNTQLCLELEIENKSQYNFSIGYSKITVGGYEFETKFEDYWFAAKEKKTVGMWVNLDIISITQASIDKLNLDISWYLHRDSSSPDHGMAEYTVRLPEKILLPKPEIEPTSFFELSNEYGDYAMEFLGISLREDDYRGEMLWRINVKGKREYWTQAEANGRLKGLEADGVPIPTQPEESYVYGWASGSSYGEAKDYFTVPFFYGNSRYVHPDEMNVLHSSTEPPKELKIDLDFDYTVRAYGYYVDDEDYENKYECTFSAVISVDEDGKSYIKDVETSMTPKPKE